jgi:hypothetical protein
MKAEPAMKGVPVEAEATKIAKVKATPRKRTAAKKAPSPVRISKARKASAGGYPAQVGVPPT